jgi:serine protease AprX
MPEWSTPTEKTQMMKKTILTAMMSLFVLALNAGQAPRIAYPGGHYHIYRIYLKDKKGGKYSLKKPEAFLSAKALQRRERQHLPLDSTDLPLSERYLKTLQDEGAEVIGGSKWNNTAIVKVTDTTLMKRIDTLPFVIRRLHVFASPDSTDGPETEKLFEGKIETEYPATSEYGDGEHQIDMLNGIKLHQAGFRGKGMTIAIIDGGFKNVDKIPLLNNVHILGKRDCVYPYNADLNTLLDHGTMVLSTMAAHADSLLTGTAPEADYYLLRSEDGRSEQLVEEDYWAQAAELADSLGADIINSSLGYARFDDIDMNHRYRDQNGNTALNSATASRLADKGIILVNSAGNDGNSSWKRINCPADAKDILAVAALKGDSMNATFSSVGPSIDGRVKPDVSAMGYRSAVIRGNGKLTTANGTSFASPTLCGMVACLWQALPQLTARQIMNLVRQAGDRSDCPDNVYGYGIPDFWKAYLAGSKQ